MNIITNNKLTELEINAKGDIESIRNSVQIFVRFSKTGKKRIITPLLRTTNLILIICI